MENREAWSEIEPLGPIFGLSDDCLKIDSFVQFPETALKNAFPQMASRWPAGCSVQRKKREMDMMAIHGSRRQVFIGVTVALLTAIGGGLVGCRQAVQYGSNAGSDSASTQPQAGQPQTVPQLQTSLEVNYGPAGLDKRSAHPVQGQNGVFELDAPIVVPAALSGPVSLSLKSGMLAALGNSSAAASITSGTTGGYGNGASANVQVESLTTTQMNMVVDSNFFPGLRDQIKAASENEVTMPVHAILTIEGDQGKMTVLIPLRNPPASPQVSFKSRHLSASQAFQLADGSWALAVGDLRIENGSGRDLDLHLNRKVSGNLLKGFTRTTVSQGDCGVQPEVTSRVSPLSSELFVLSAGESASILSSLIAQENQPTLQQKIRGGAVWQGTLYAIRQASFGKSFQPEQCFVGPPQLLVPGCQTGKCKSMHVTFFSASLLGVVNEILQCDQNGNRTDGAGPCPAEGPGAVCSEHWITPDAPIPVSNTTDVLGLGLVLSPKAFSARMTYSDMTFDSPHQATDVVLSEARLPVVGNVPFDAPIGDIPEECPLNE